MSEQKNIDIYMQQKIKDSKILQVLMKKYQLQKMTDNNRCAHQWSTSTCLNSEKWTNRLKFIYQQEVKKKRPDTDTKTETVMNIPESQAQQCQPMCRYLYYLQWKLEARQVDRLDRVEYPVKKTINKL